MKLHISYNFPDLSHALDIAQHTAEFADIIGVGSLLLFKEGAKAIKSFKAAFPHKEIFAEAFVVEKAPEAVGMFAQAGARYVSVLAGTYHNAIKKAVETAKEFDAKIMLDLLDAHSIGQSALDAKTLGVNSIIMHRTRTPDAAIEIDSEWQHVRENTQLPVFITGKIDESNIQQLIALKPQGIMIGAAITKADNPAKQAQFFKSLL